VGYITCPSKGFDSWPTPSHTSFSVAPRATPATSTAAPVPRVAPPTGNSQHPLPPHPQRLPSQRPLVQPPRHLQQQRPLVHPPPSPPRAAPRAPPSSPPARTDSPLLLLAAGVGKTAALPSPTTVAIVTRGIPLWHRAALVRLLLCTQPNLIRFCNTPTTKQYRGWPPFSDHIHAYRYTFESRSFHVRIYYGGGGSVHAAYSGYETAQTLSCRRTPIASTPENTTSFGVDRFMLWRAHQ
jgi:hypothetical protein